MEPSFDSSNQSAIIIGEPSFPKKNNDSASQSLMITGEPQPNKDNDSSTSEPPSVEKSKSKEYSFSQFHQSMQCIIKCLTQVKQKSQTASQFMEQGYDLLDNDMSSINFVPPSLASSFSFDAFLDLSQTSPIHFYNALEQLCDSHSRRLAEEKEFQQLKQQMEEVSVKKEKLGQENHELKQKVELLKMKCNNQKNQRDLFQKKYIQQKKQATKYKSKLDRIRTYQDKN